MGLNLTLAELKKLLEKKQGSLEKLYARREKLAAKLAEVDAEISDIVGDRAARKKPAGTGRRGRPPKAAPAPAAESPQTEPAPLMPRKRGRPRRTMMLDASAIVSEPPASESTAEAPASAPPARPAPQEKTAPARTGPRLADLMVKVLQNAPDLEMNIVQLAIEVEKLGYVSKNTEQVIRLTSGRGGKFEKTEDDRIKLLQAGS